MPCYSAAEPPGAHHGLGHQAHGRAVGPVGSSSLHHQVRGRFPQLSDHAQIRLARHDRVDRRGSGLQCRHGDPGSPGVPQGRDRRPEADQTAGPAGKGVAAIHRPDAPSGDDQSAEPRVRVLDLVIGAAGGASGQDNRHPRGYGPAWPPAAAPGVLVPASQAHDEGQAGRGGVREIQGGADLLKKKPFARTPPKHWFSRTRSRYIATRR